MTAATAAVVAAVDLPVGVQVLAGANTAALAVAVPVVWAQMTIVNEDGYAALSASAAGDARLQEAMAGELTTQLVSLGDDNGYSLNPVLVRQVAASYTGNDGFAGQFAQANRIAHRWMFTGAVPSGNSTDDYLVRKAAEDIGCAIGSLNSTLN